MGKKKKGTVPKAEPPEAVNPRRTLETGEVTEIFHRVMVLVRNADFQRMMQEGFAEGKPVQCTVHPLRSSRSSERARAYRKAYRQRPEVRERMKTYRKARRQRIREAAKRSEQQGVESTQV